MAMTSAFSPTIINGLKNSNLYLGYYFSGSLSFEGENWVCSPGVSDNRELTDEHSTPPSSLLFLQIISSFLRGYSRISWPALPWFFLGEDDFFPAWIS